MARIQVSIGAIGPILLWLVAACSAFGQGSTGTASRIIWGPSLPATCSHVTGQVFFKNATPSIGPYYCDENDDWQPMAGGGGGGGSGNAAVIVPTTFSATPTFTCPSSTAGTLVTFTLTTALTTSITSSTLSACGTNGQILMFVAAQDATGGRTFAYPTGFTNVPPISAVALSTTTVTVNWNGTTARLIGYSTVDAGDAIILPEQSSSPAGLSASGVLYTKTDHMPYIKLNAGAEDRVCTLSAGCGASSGGTAVAPYSTTVTAQTSVTITAATHGQGTLAWPECLDGSTPRVAVACQFNRNTSGDLAFNFAPAFTGQIQIGSGGGTNITPYSSAVTAQTSVSLSAATHGKGTTPRVDCFNNASPARLVACDPTRNGSGDLVFTFAPAFTGTIEVRF